MKIIKIIRISEEESCTRGVMLLDNIPVAVTLELPNLSNQKNVSCIPLGVYKAKVVPHETRTTGGYGKLIRLYDVPNREGILIHVGNTVVDTEGCILVGKSYGKVLNKPAVLESRDAFFKLMQQVEGDLEVRIEGHFDCDLKLKEEKPVKPEKEATIKSKLEVVNHAFNRRGSRGTKATN